MMTMDAAEIFGLGALVATTVALLVLVGLGVALYVWCRSWAGRWRRVEATRDMSGIWLQATFDDPTQPKAEEPEE